MFKLIKKLRDLFLAAVIWRKYKIGKGFHAGSRVRIWSKNELIIGRDFYIGKDSQIECDAQIGDYVMLGNKVGLIGRYDHHYQQFGVPMHLASQIREPDYSWKGLNMKIVIEDDVWVGYGSIILSGVKIGTGSIIGAGSVVTRDVEPYSIYGGIPAKKIGNRFENELDLKKHIQLYKQNFKKG
jgi:chloramphenicol O-acetyltransferase type B